MAGCIMPSNYVVKSKNEGKRPDAGTIAEAIINHVKEKGLLLTSTFRRGHLFQGTAEDEGLLKQIYDTCYLPTHIWVPTVYPHIPRVEFETEGIRSSPAPPPRPSGPRTPALPALAHRSFVLERPPAL